MLSVFMAKRLIPSYLNENILNVNMRCRGAAATVFRVDPSLCLLIMKWLNDMILVLIDQTRERIYVPAQATLSQNMLHVRDKWKFRSISDLELRSSYSPIADDRKAEKIFQEAKEAFGDLQALHGGLFTRICAYLSNSVKQIQRFAKSTKYGEYLSDGLG